jgi:hypothetical protein
MTTIRHRGAFKPWGSAVSALEMALWDLAGKAAGVPVYKLLGGKVRDRVRVYNGAVRFPMTGYEPADYAVDMQRMKDAPEAFTIIKSAIAFHTPMAGAVPNFFYGDPGGGGHGQPERGLLTERGLAHVVDCVKAMKDVLGDEVGASRSTSRRRVHTSRRRIRTSSTDGVASRLTAQLGREVVGEGLADGGHPDLVAQRVACDLQGALDGGDDLGAGGAGDRGR